MFKTQEGNKFLDQTVNSDIKASYNRTYDIETSADGTTPSSNTARGHHKLRSSVVVGDRKQQQPEIKI
jgi:hypothetical protein